VVVVGGTVVVVGGATFAETSSSAGELDGGGVVDVVVGAGGAVVVVVVGGAVVVDTAADAERVSEASLQAGTVPEPEDALDDPRSTFASGAATPDPLCINTSGTTSKAPHNASAAMGRPFD
jgi:hypothetical protein